MVISHRFSEVDKRMYQNDKNGAERAEIIKYAYLTSSLSSPWDFVYAPQYLSRGIYAIATARNGKFKV